MRYATPAALRAALDQRLVQEATASGADIARLRRRVTFERILVRLALADEGRWVLKGGAAVEVRLTDRARATRDIDVAIREGNDEHLDVREALVEALLVDRQGDYFEFRLDRFRDMNIDGALGPVWRASVDCLLDGRTFDRVVVDVVTRPSEAQRVEPIRLPGTLSFAEIPPVEILAVDLNQHFAEKLHAMVRQYGDRPSSRVKDLVDLILFIDIELEPTDELVRTVDDVFSARGSDGFPAVIPAPPGDWAARYEELAVDLELSASTLADAMTSLRTFWARALDTHQET
jgi:hypothetical protein